MVRGHQEVVPGLGVQVFQGAPQLSWWGRGVSAVPQPGECAREIPPCFSWPDGSPKDRQVAPDSPSDRIAPALWLVGSPLEDGHHDMRGQGLCRELQRRPPSCFDHRAPWGSEDVATGPTDRHPSPQAGNDHDRYVMTALACHSRGSMPVGCVCHVHTHPRLASWTVTMSRHGTTWNGVSREPCHMATPPPTRSGPRTSPHTPPLGALLLSPLPPLPAAAFRGPGRGSGCGPG